MTVSSIKVRLPTKFPSSVSVSSPLTLSQTGGNFAFGLDATALEVTTDALYAKLASNLSDLSFPYTAKDNISKHGADIASAATVNLETATGDLVDVTGTVAITAITLSEGHERTVRFTGILTLTNGASLVLPGGANITTAAGDFARFRGYASGVVRCVGYNPATGKSTVAPAVGDITGLGTGIAAALAINTGTAGAPALFSGALGTATATSINKVAITAPATSATLTLVDGTTLTGPAASGTAMTLGNAETVTGAKTFGSAGAVGKLKIAGTTSGSTILDATAAASGTLTLPAATDTLVGKATTDTLTNKTLDSAGTGNVLKVSGVTVSAGQFPGTTTNDNATAGNIGEYSSSSVVSGSAISLTTNTPVNLASLSLTAGDWDVWCHVLFTAAGTTNITQLAGSISTTSATLNTAPTNFSQFTYPSSVIGASNTMVPDVRTRISINATTTIFCVAQATFTVSTLTTWGSIQARRVR